MYVVAAASKREVTHYTLTSRKPHLCKFPTDPLNHVLLLHNQYKVDFF